MVQTDLPFEPADDSQSVLVATQLVQELCLLPLQRQEVWIIGFPVTNPLQRQLLLVDVQLLEFADELLQKHLVAPGILAGGWYQVPVDQLNTRIVEGVLNLRIA